MSKFLFEELGSVFLDPRHAGSSIRWNVNTRVWKHDKEHVLSVSGNVSLTDCHRTISWELGYSDHYDAKLTKAIEELTACRNALRKARKAADKWCKENGKTKPIED